MYKTLDKYRYFLLLIPAKVAPVCSTLITSAILPLINKCTINISICHSVFFLAMLRYHVTFYRKAFEILAVFDKFYARLGNRFCVEGIEAIQHSNYTDSDLSADENLIAIARH